MELNQDDAEWMNAPMGPVSKPPRDAELKESDDGESMRAAMEFARSKGASMVTWPGAISHRPELDTFEFTLRSLAQWHAQLTRTPPRPEPHAQGALRCPFCNGEFVGQTGHNCEGRGGKLVVIHPNVAQPTTAHAEVAARLLETKLALTAAESAAAELRKERDECQRLHAEYEVIARGAIDTRAKNNAELAESNKILRTRLEAVERERDQFRELAQDEAERRALQVSCMGENNEALRISLAKAVKVAEWAMQNVRLPEPLREGDNRTAFYDTRDTHLATLAAIRALSPAAQTTKDQP